MWLTQPGPPFHRAQNEGGVMFWPNPSWIENHLCSWILWIGALSSLGRIAVLNLATTSTCNVKESSRWRFEVCFVGFSSNSSSSGLWWEGILLASKISGIVRGLPFSPEVWRSSASSLFEACMAVLCSTIICRGVITKRWPQNPCMSVRGDILWSSTSASHSKPPLVFWKFTSIVFQLVPSPKLRWL